MAFWRVCPGFARFLREGSTRVDCHRMEVPRVSFAWPIWILSKTIRSLLSKDLPTACQLLVSVLSVPPAVPRLFASLLANWQIFRIIFYLLSRYCQFSLGRFFEIDRHFQASSLRYRGASTAIRTIFAILCTAFIFAI